MQNNFIFGEHGTVGYFGKDVVAEHLPKLAAQYGENVLLCYGGGSVKKNGAYDDVMAVLKDAGKKVTEFSNIPSNPTLDMAYEGIALAKKIHADLILAVGAGSVMDMSKAISIGAATDLEIWDNFWIGDTPIDFDPVPLGMVVTMPATGSESNGCAVLTNTKTKIKCDKNHPESNAKFALMDPTYTFTVPKRQLLAGTFDILSHVMKAYFSEPVQDNLSDDISEAMMKEIIRDLRISIQNPMDWNARSNLMWVDFVIGSRLIKMGKLTDFQCHNMEHQLSAYNNCVHGEGLAVLHPVYYRHIYKAGAAKFAKFAKNVWGLNPSDYETEEALAAAGIEALADFIKEVGLPTTLREIGYTENDDLKTIAESCFISKGSLKILDFDDISEIYKEAL